ncbi:MAG: SDR family NAD(P)-dependent oxidoreductase [bacterium]
MIDAGLNDRVVLVTGANHGLGAATAAAFAAQGAAVFITYLGPPGPDAVLHAIRSNGGRAESWEADLVDVAVIPRLFDRAEHTFGPVEVLVNNAAWAQRPDTFVPAGADARTEWGDRRLLTLSPELIDGHHAVNARAPALLIAEFARRHIARGARWGRIINVSTNGASGFRGHVSYGASKHALESYSSAAAVELGPYGITVSVVASGAMDTGWLTDHQKQTVIAKTPLKRVGTAEDVADVIVFLASEQARWLTGQLIYADGGDVMPL